MSVQRTWLAARPLSRLRLRSITYWLVMIGTIMATAGLCRASTLSEAQAAFNSDQFKEANRIWSELARAAEPEAAYQLGLMADLGLGQPPDRALAFTRYLEAARLGHAAAQFNVGVMLDAGTGGLSSLSAASTWYARAAAKGVARAQYNLALLYAEADGVPGNVGFARAWMSQAADELPAARERLVQLPSLDPDATHLRLEAPLPLSASIVQSASGAGLLLELVWTASEQPTGTLYRVELEGADGMALATGSGSIDVSALDVSLPEEKPRRWRILATSGEQTRASDWQPLSSIDKQP